MVSQRDSALSLLPWQAGWVSAALAQVRSHAVLLHGPQGAGQLPLGMAMAKAWLCEAPGREGAAAHREACGQCPSCHLFDQGYHPDLKVVLPEDQLPSLGWAHLLDAEGEEGEGKKRKPSREIKVEAIRQVVSFSQSTMSRGRARVVVVHPAQRMNTVAANTLLKTLEEPPGQVRFVLTCDQLDDVLPTIRSRCQPWALPVLDEAQALPWLQQQAAGPKAAGLSEADARLLLAAAGGSPLTALALLQQGWSADMWQDLPQALARGEAHGWAQWPLTEVVTVQQKLCHDLACAQAGGSPRFFPAEALAGLLPVSLHRLAAWDAELRVAQRQSEHPWSMGLKVQALVQRAQQALRSSVH